MQLKRKPETLSIDRTAEWIEKVSQERISYFDHLLMKIDSIVRDTVNPEAVLDISQLSEFNQELAFMEHELEQISKALEGIHRGNLHELAHLSESLEGLQDHLSQLRCSQLPRDLEEKMNKMEEMILIYLLRIRLF
jgi:hypothetical protein